MDYAAIHGNLPVIKDIYNKMTQVSREDFKYSGIDYEKFLTNSLNHAMVLAADHGHKDIVDFLIEKGATDFDRAFIEAAFGGHIDLMRDFLSRGVSSGAFKEALKAAVGGNQIESTNLVLNYGKDYLIGKDLIDALDHAVRLSELKGLKTMIEWMNRQDSPLVFSRETISDYLDFSTSDEIHDYLEQYYRANYQ